MTIWRQARWAAFDVESTGVDTKNCRIVSAAVVHVGADQPTDPWLRLVNPGVPIPAAATEVHRITDAMVQADGIPAADAIDQIAEEVAASSIRGEVLVAFNVAFDFTMLHYECLRYGVPTVEQRIGGGLRNLLDPHVIDKAMDKYRKGKRTLTATCERYGVVLGKDAHSCDADALASARLMYKLFGAYPELEEMSLLKLYTAQRAWRAEQNAGLQGHFDRLRKDGADREVVQTGWPMYDMATEASP